MGISAEGWRKLKKKEMNEKTMKYWLSSNTRLIDRRFSKPFDNEYVIYRVTFANKDDPGQLELLKPGSAAANQAAAQLLQQYSPLLTNPPNELPFKKGLLIKFTKRKMTVKLASARFPE